jgi:hypothetical protein
MNDRKSYFQITLRIDEETYHELEQIRKDTGLSLREIVAWSSEPCPCCPDVDVHAYTGKSSIVRIRRGILFNSLLTKYQTYDKPARAV